MNPFLLLTIFMIFVASAFANPLPSPHLVSRDSLHACEVFIQRWYDSSFDIYVYNSTDINSRPFITAESVALTPPKELPITQAGSYKLIITDVANPTNNNDPGKLSFVWGHESWDSWTGTQCSVIPVGNYGAHYGYPTNTSCTFQCDY